MEWLAKMRLKSDASKNKLALVVAGLITLLVVGIWILILKNQKTSDEVVTKSKSDELKPLFMIFKKAKEDFKTIKTDIRESKSKVDEMVPAVDVLESP